MKKLMSVAFLLGCTAIAFLATPSKSDAQIGIRIGGGGGFYPGGSNYGRSYYGGGYGGRGYGYGYGPGSYYGPNRGGFGIGIGVNPGYGAVGYGVNNGYYARPGVSVGIPLQTQSFYPPMVADVPSGIPSAPFAIAPPNDGRGRIEVIVPANAEVFWNGIPSTLTGATRRYGTLPLTPEGAVQKFDARWTGQDGQPVSQTREVRAMPNTTVTVDFTRPQSDEKTPTSN